MKSKAHRFFNPNPKLKELAYSHLVLICLLSRDTIIPMNHKSFLPEQLTVLPNNIMKWEGHVAEVKVVFLS